MRQKLSGQKDPFIFSFPNNHNSQYLICNLRCLMRLYVLINWNIKYIVSMSPPICNVILYINILSLQIYHVYSDMYIIFYVYPLSGNNQITTG